MENLTFLYNDKNSGIKRFYSLEADVLSLVSWSAIMASGSVFWQANVRIRVRVDY